MLNVESLLTTFLGTSRMFSPLQYYVEAYKILLMQKFLQNLHATSSVVRVFLQLYTTT